MRVDDADHDVRRIDRLQRLDDAELLDRFFDARAASHAGGVDQRVAAAVALERHEHRIARRARLIERDQALFAQQPIDQRRLADVRPADHRDADVDSRPAASRLVGELEALERALHQRTNAVAVRRRNRLRLAQAELVEVGAGGCRVDAFGLVGDDG